MSSARSNQRSAARRFLRSRTIPITTRTPAIVAAMVATFSDGCVIPAPSTLTPMALPSVLAASTKKNTSMTIVKLRRWLHTTYRARAPAWKRRHQPGGRGGDAGALLSSCVDLRGEFAFGADRVEPLEASWRCVSSSAPTARASRTRRVGHRIVGADGAAGERSATRNSTMKVM